MSINELHRNLRNTEATIANAAGLDRGLVTFEAGETVTIRSVAWNGAEGRAEAMVESVAGGFRSVALSALRTAR